MVTFSESANTSGTSWYDGVIKNTGREIIQALNIHPNEGDGDKVIYNWDIDAFFDNGDLVSFAIYDWKEYREFDLDEVIEWHIGTKNYSETVIIVDELQKLGLSANIVKSF